MTTEEKLEKIKKLADDMYYAAANLGTTVGSGEYLSKTMEEYHKFIIHEYNKDEPNFKVGDKIRYLPHCGTIMTIEKLENNEYVFANNMGHISIKEGNKWELIEECNITGIKSRHATGKLKECIDNQTKDGLDKARKQLEEESKAKFKVGDKVMYLNEEYVVTDNKDHYTLRSTKERTSVSVVHIDFGNEDYELSLVEKSKKCMYTKYNSFRYIPSIKHIISIVGFNIFTILI